MNKGNHENRKLNSRYGFEKEVHKKYNAELYDLIQSTFEELPLYHLIDEKVFVLHGGLFEQDDVTIEELEEIKKPISKMSDERVKSILKCSIWSDPTNETDDRDESSRGAGVLFGKNVTKNFIKSNDLELVIRSHQCVEEGYEFNHDNYLITVFSCSNYCKTNTNRGAVVTFEDKRDKYTPNFFTYHALESKDYDIAENAKKQSIDFLRCKIYLQKVKLFHEFNKISKNKSQVSKQDWARIMKKVLKVNLAFEDLLEYLADEENGKVNYIQFLNRYQIKISGEKFIQLCYGSICKKILSNHQEIEKYFDKISSDGIISDEDLIQAIKDLDLGISDREIFDLVSTIDQDKNGLIDHKEFMKAFKVNFNFEKNNEILSEIGEKLLKSFKTLKESFIKIDQDKNGFIEKNEFINHLKSSYNQDKLKELFENIDKNHDGKISWQEFEDAFIFEKHEKYQDRLLQRVLETLFEMKSDLLTIFHKIDKDGSNELTVKEFTHGIKKLNDSLKSFTKEEIENLYFLIDMNHNGKIDYEEFLDAFKIIDLKSTN